MKKTCDIEVKLKSQLCGTKTTVKGYREDYRSYHDIVNHHVNGMVSVTMQVYNDKGSNFNTQTLMYNACDVESIRIHNQTQTAY